MKSLLLIPILALGSLPVEARTSQRGYSNQCFEEVYREEYIPGTVQTPGRIRSYVENVEVPCSPAPTVRETRPEPPVRSTANRDDNSCVEGSILGGIAGGALGGTLSTQENWIWSIPTGIIGGAMVGCQVDGG
jgi:hypothetical protein